MLLDVHLVSEMLITCAIRWHLVYCLLAILSSGSRLWTTGWAMASKLFDTFRNDDFKLLFFLTSSGDYFDLLLCHRLFPSVGHCCAIVHGLFSELCRSIRCTVNTNQFPCSLRLSLTLVTDGQNGRRKA